MVFNKYRGKKKKRFIKSGLKHTFVFVTDISLSPNRICANLNMKLFLFFFHLGNFLLLALGRHFITYLVVLELRSFKSYKPHFNS